MATEEDNKDDAAAEDPFAGWAEALEEQKRTDEKPGDAEQGGPLSGDPVRPFSGAGGGMMPRIDARARLSGRDAPRTADNSIAAVRVVVVPAIRERLR